MNLTALAVVAAMGSALFGAWGAVHVWRTSLVPHPDGTVSFTARDPKTLVIMLLSPGLATLSAALSVAALLSAK